MRDTWSPAMHDAHITANGYGRGVIKYVTDDRGTVMLEICDECFCITAWCLHEKNSWDEVGEILTCNLCGKDVT